MRTRQLKKITITAIFTAFTAAATMVITIPIASSGGYVNFGDTVIFAAAALLGPVGGLITGAIGSAIADLIFAPKWIPITLIVKGLEGFLCGLLITVLRKKHKKDLPLYILSMTAAAMLMVIGYFFGGWLLEGLSAGSFKTGFAVSMYDVPFNLIQGGVSVVVGTIITAALLKIKLVRTFIEDIHSKK